jgi:hypothetical protein
MGMDRGTGASTAEPPGPRERRNIGEVLWGLVPLLMLLAAWWVVSALGSLEENVVKNRSVACAQAIASGYALEQLDPCTEPEVASLFDANARPANPVATPAPTLAP